MKKIAIIGTGISGLGAAYLLAKDYDVTVYEKNDYIGGHSRTITVPGRTGPVPVDTGFIVFNDRNYPNLLGLFNQLDVPYVNSKMSFGVSINNGWLEYASGGLLAQKRNLARPPFYRMLADILRFNRQALRYIERDPTISLQQCMDELKMGDWFKRYYLLAMGAAIWSCPIETILSFPAHTFLRFFNNHGLLSINDHPQWYTVEGGSREYVKRLTAGFSDKIKLGAAVASVQQYDDRWQVHTIQGEVDAYDHIVFASHADETLSLIAEPTAQEQSILGAFSYQANQIIVHSDVRFMPKRRQCWASWVYLSTQQQDKKPCVSLSYWMNNLQPIDTDTPILVTLNPDSRPQQSTIIDEHTFTHPVFDLPAIQAQGQLNEIQGKRNLWFCGAYQRYGFHEDGIASAVNVAQQLGSKIPWA